MQDSMVGRAETRAKPSAMSWVLTACIVLLVIGPAWPPGADPAVAADRPPEIHADALTHRFPPVYEGEPLSHAFRIENRGGTDLHVKRVTSS